jgi:hypothetical protein
VSNGEIQNLILREAHRESLYGSSKSKEDECGFETTILLEWNEELYS